MCERRVRCAILLRCSSSCHRDRTLRDGKICPNIGDVVIAVRQRSLTNRIRTNSFTSDATQRTSQPIRSNQRASGDGVRQGRICCTVFFRICCSGHRDWALRYRKVRRNIRNGVVAVCQCVLSNRIRTDSFTRCATQRTGQRIANNQ